MVAAIVTPISNQYRMAPGAESIGGSMRKGMIVGILALLGGGIGACGAGGPGGNGSATAVVDTVAGIERLRYPGSGGASLTVRVDTVAVIGGAEVEDEAYHFDQVLGDALAADEAGRLFVLDRAGNRVLVYDSAGRHLATFGRAGGGPGELAAPASLALGPGDSIWVADVGNRRYTIIPTDGGDPRSVPFPEEAGVGLGTLVVRDGGPIQSFRALMGGRVGGPGAEGPPAEPPRVILRLSGAGAILDTLWLTPPPQVDEVRSANAAQDRMVVIRMPRAFETQQHWRALSDGTLVVADTAEYILRLIDRDGTMLRRIERALPTRETTEADMEKARERLRERLVQGGGIRITVGGGGGASGPPPEQFIEAQVAAMTFAPVIPRVTGVRVDPLDRIWVGVSLDEPETTERIDIYDRHGNLLGELRGHPLPDVFIGPSFAANLDRDEFDVQQLVLYRFVVDDAR